MDHSHMRHSLLIMYMHVHTLTNILSVSYVHLQSESLSSVFPNKLSPMPRYVITCADKLNWLALRHKSTHAHRFDAYRLHVIVNYQLALAGI